jgi:hypothetical protein
MAGLVPAIHVLLRAPSSTNDLMKDEYDFSTAERGKFFREGARLVPPSTSASRCLTISASSHIS